MITKFYESALMVGGDWEMRKKVNEIIDAIGVLADELNQLALITEEVDFRATGYPATPPINRLHALRDRISHLIPDEADL